MNLGMQGLEATFEKLGGSGVFRDVDDREASFAECFGGAAGGEKFDAVVLVESLGKFDQSGFIGNRQERT